MVITGGDGESDGGKRNLVFKQGVDDVGGNGVEEAG
jgi:hypothetical protein